MELVLVLYVTEPLFVTNGYPGMEILLGGQLQYKFVFLIQMEVNWLPSVICPELISLTMSHILYCITFRF
jgi:hypothetical protein